jgi:hypothetical protein
MKPSAYRFVPWLLFFFLSLVSISFLIALNQLFIAKIIGFTVTITLVIVLRIWLHRLKLSAQPERINLNTNDVHELVRYMPLFSKLSPSDQKNFKHRVGLQMSLIHIENPEAINVSEFSPRILANAGTFSLTADTLQISLEEVVEQLKNIDAAALQKVVNL